MSATILFTYPHRVDDKTIVQLPIFVDDVDEMGLWVHLEPDAHTRWGGCLLWSNLLEAPLKRMVEVIREEEGKATETPNAEDST